MDTCKLRYLEFNCPRAQGECKMPKIYKIYWTLFQTGGLLNVKNLISKAMATKCMFCNESGASINCTKSRCDSSFHFLCGRKANVTFHENKVKYFLCRRKKIKNIFRVSFVLTIRWNRFHLLQLSTIESFLSKLTRSAR